MQANFSLPQKIATFQSWFEVYKVSEGTFAICESGHWDGAISYLIEGWNKAVLLDTGMGFGDIKKVIEQLTRLKVSVVNSHTHFDHVGGNHQFDEIAVFDDNFEIENLERGYAIEELKGELSKERLFKPLPKGFDLKTYRILPSKPTHLLKHEELIDLGDRKLKVLHTPGHSPGSICLLDTKSRELFTGDTFYLSSLLANLPESDFLAYSRTADYLASLTPSISVLRPSHDDSRRQPFAESEFLVRLAKACKNIKAEKANFSSGVCPYTGVKIRDYRFEGFSIWVKQETE
ncbi:MAG: MBL fold metallo-hydrolase [Candidatus Bathyarchaeota archaeon]|nr:MBL fold metallo-hydrolase [Candidatus Bathyarchaeota archaeon]